MKNTKIICTIGPASDDEKTLKKMVIAGMNVVRLNFSHGSYDNFLKIIRNVRKVSKDLDKPVAIVQDLQGPKIRTGNIPAPGIIIKNGEVITLTSDKSLKDGIPFQYKKLPADVSIKDKLLIADGIIELEVISKNKKNIVCKVITGGLVSAHKGINVPTASISADPLTAKDRKDLVFGLKNNVDFVALSFVRSGQDIKKLRKILNKHHSKAKIIAKIERHEALKNIEEIIMEADAIMVARGDMGVEVPPETVPVHQKKIIHLANLHGKTVITATEMMQSMITQPRPTRAEVSDIANAVYDHTDAIMLSNESAVGK